MGVIEISDGVSNRRIAVPELDGTIRIELEASGSSQIIVPEGSKIERHVDSLEPVSRV